MNSLKVQENVGFTGKVRVTKYKAGTKEVIFVSEWSPNKIMNGTLTGLNGILARLASDNTQSLNIKFGELGSGSTPPAYSDVALATAVDRTPINYASVAGNVVSLFFFWADADLANGSYPEFGAFVDGSATLGTGYLFERALFASAYVKGSGEDTTVQLDITGSV